MDEATKQVILSVVRSSLLAIGGVLTTKGWATDTDVQLYLGAAMIILTAAVGGWDKLHAEKKTQARETIAVNSGIVASNEIPDMHPPVTAGEAQQIIAALGPTVQPEPKP